MLYPIKFKSRLKVLVWGSESWEISGVPGSESVVDGGALDGKTITELVREYKGKLVGEKVYERFGDEFPLLIKFIDAKKDLSVQVHPSDELAARKGLRRGKTEMWYVIRADEGARLISGLSKAITPDEYETLVKNGRITDVLSSFDVRPGDVFFLPAGRIHAIGAGCYLAEIQETSDVTYRIYDYGRPGLDGKPRQLHIAEAREAIDYNVYPDYRTTVDEKPGQENVLVDCNFFTTSVYNLLEPLTCSLADMDSFLAVMCLCGEGSLSVSIPRFSPEGLPEATKGHLQDIRPGETILIPACATAVTFRPKKDSPEVLKLLTSHL